MSRDNCQFGIDTTEISQTCNRRFGNSSSSRSEVTRGNPDSSDENPGEFIGEFVSQPEPASVEITLSRIDALKL